MKISNKERKSFKKYTVVININIDYYYLYCFRYNVVYIVRIDS